MIDVIRRYGICPEEAMPAPGSLTGDSFANFRVFFPELEREVSSIIWNEGKPELNRFTTEEQNTTYIFLNRNALPKKLRKAVQL